MIKYVTEFIGTFVFLYVILQSGKFGDVFDPATGDVVSRVPFGGVEEIAAAINAATDALPNWAATPPIQRARVMFRFKALIEEHMDDIAVLVSSEHGKTLEDARIGGSPLEKSTRYVSFAEKISGESGARNEFRFFQDQNLLNSSHRDLYLNTCRNLFETYINFTEPIRIHVRECLPKDPHVSLSAYESSVRARGFDIIRGLLPSSTLTNMGIFGNGRFFETIISKLRVESLLELNQIGESAFCELSKVIPSFIRRAEKNHKYFKDFQNYGAAKKNVFNNFLTKNLITESIKVNESVSLIDYDRDAEIKLLSALLYPYSELSLTSIREKLNSLPQFERTKLIKDTIELRSHRRHKPDRGLEMVFYTFDILGDYGVYRDLQRHRMLTQERQMLSTNFGYFTPFEIEDVGLGSDYHDAMERSAHAYNVISNDFPFEAQYVVPMGYNIRWFMHINLRSLIWLTEIRSTPQGHTGYRKIAQEMFKKVEEVHPLLAKYMKYVDLDDYSLGRLNSEIRKENKKQ